MNKADARTVKKSVLKCLTTDFEYGRRKDGKPLKRPKKNQRIFDAKRGYAVFNGTDLEMVMEAVVLGIYLAIDEKEEA